LLAFIEANQTGTLEFYFVYTESVALHILTFLFYTACFKNQSGLRPLDF